MNAPKLTISQFKAEQRDGVTMNESRTLRQGAKKDRSSILVESKTYDSRGSTLWETKRVGTYGLPTALAEQLDPKVGDDLNALLASIGLGAHTIQMVEGTSPFYEGQEPKLNPSTQEVVTNAEGVVLYQDYNVVPLDLKGNSHADVRESRPVVATEAVADPNDMA